MVEQTELVTSWTLVADQSALENAATLLAAGNGPVGVDAERASGFRYGSEAYLVQVYRRGAGTFIFDPTQLESFEPLSLALADTEWILHAASQDLACLTAIGLVPPRVFDTELASRLLGFERVGLGSIVEQLLGIKLEKAHSSADWSTRPLPDAWLEYAALDVVLLPDLRDLIAAELVVQGKTEFAAQEFQAVLQKPAKKPVSEPWRKLAGGNRLKSQRELALARELWNARDKLARTLDVAPGRLLPDASLIVAANLNPRSKGQLASNKDFRGRASRTELDRWWAAIMRAKNTDDLPGAKPRETDSIPHHRHWAQRFPDAAARLSAAREAVTDESERQGMPVENLLTPDTLRRVAWEPPLEASPEHIAARLRELGAREWQATITAPIISSAFETAR